MREKSGRKAPALRACVIAALQTVHGILLMMLLFAIFLMIIRTEEREVLLRCLFWIPMVAVFSFLTMRVPRTWQYLLLALAAACGAAFAGDVWYLTVAYEVGVALIVIPYFRQRVLDAPCWLESPTDFWLILFLAAYLIAAYLSYERLARVIAVGAGVYFLLCRYHVNLRELEHFIGTHAQLERFPVRRMGQINRIMLASLTALCVCAMFVTPYLGLDVLIRRFLAFLRQLIAWLLSRAPEGEDSAAQTEESAGQAGEQQMLPQTEEGNSLFWEILYRVLLAAFVVGLVIGLFYLLRYLVRQLYSLYGRFQANVMENGDQVEQLAAEPIRQEREDLRKKRALFPFLDRSVGARIRRHYRKTVLRARGGPPDPAWTPARIEEGLSLPPEDREYFHSCYEKTRYGREECSREEMQRMLDIRNH